MLTHMVLIHLLVFNDGAVAAFFVFVSDISAKHGFTGGK